MKVKRNWENGFTLLEVLIAMSIIALVVAQLSSAIGQNHFTLTRLEEKTLAHIVAMNKMTEIQIQPGWPALGKVDTIVDMARRSWEVSTQVQPTEDPQLRLVEIQVGIVQENKMGSQTQYIARLRGVKGDKPFF